MLMLHAVAELTLLFNLFQGEPPVQGPAKKTQFISAPYALLALLLAIGRQEIVIFSDCHDIAITTTPSIQKSC